MKTLVTAPTAQAERNCARCAWRKPAWVVVVVAALLILFVSFDLQQGMRKVLEEIERLGPLGPVLFIAAYILATVLFLPGSVLTLGAGAIFGVVWGSVYVSLGSTLGATAAFLVGRYAARGWVEKKIAGNQTFAAIDRAVAAEGWKIVGLTRLSPVFPFSLLNYGFGVTRVGLREFILASWVGMMPGTVMYVYLGSLARVGTEGQAKSPAQWAMYGAGLIATIAVTFFVTKIARQALAQKTGNPPQVSTHHE